MKMRWFFLIIGSCAFLTSVASAAPRPPCTAAVRGWLQAVEAVPSAAELTRAGGPHLVADLATVIGNSAEKTYARHRAVAFLGLLPNAAATAALRKNLHNGDEGLRATAALAWGSGPAARGEAGANKQLTELLKDSQRSVRAAAVRGLGFAADKANARAVLTQQQRTETDLEVLAQIRTVLAR